MDWTWLSKVFSSNIFNTCCFVAHIGSLKARNCWWGVEICAEETGGLQPTSDVDTHFCSKMERATKFKCSKWLDTAWHCYLELPAQPLSSVTCSRRSRSFRAWKMQLRRARSWYRDPGQHFVRLLDHRKSAAQKKRKIERPWKNNAIFWFLGSLWIFYLILFVFSLRFGYFCTMPRLPSRSDDLARKVGPRAAWHWTAGRSHGFFMDWNDPNSQLNIGKQGRIRKMFHDLPCIFCAQSNVWFQMWRDLWPMVEFYVWRCCVR